MKKTIQRIAKHIIEVQKALAVVSDELRSRAIVHDQSNIRLMNWRVTHDLSRCQKG